MQLDRFKKFSSSNLVALKSAICLTLFSLISLGNNQASQAAILTVTPTIKEVHPGDTVDFSFTLSAEPGERLTCIMEYPCPFSPSIDSPASIEPSYRDFYGYLQPLLLHYGYLDIGVWGGLTGDFRASIPDFVEPGTTINGSVGIRFVFNDEPGGRYLSAPFALTVQAIPEPLTILGTGTALAFGSFFKRELFKKQKKKSKVHRDTFK